MRWLTLKITQLSLIGIGTIVFLYLNASWLRGYAFFEHDTVYWSGAFHYFADSLLNGFYPIWNPYLHAGEMFVESFTQIGIVDPCSLIVVLLAFLFRQHDLMWIYNLSVFTKLIVMCAGAQLLLNHLIPGLRKIWAFPFFFLLLGAFSLNGYHQNGIFLCLGYFCYAALFLLRSFDDPSWKNILAVGYFTGISLQSIVFAYQATAALIFFGLYLFLNKDQYLRKLTWFTPWKHRWLSAALLAIALSAPAWSLLFYYGNTEAYARQIFNPDDTRAGLLFSSPNDLRTSLAAIGRPADFLTLVAPKKWAEALFSARKYEVFSEMSFYSGLVVFLLVLLGLWKGEGKHRRLMICFTLVMALIYVGPPLLGIYDFFFYALFPLRAIENTHNFVNFVLLGYFYFLGLGLLYLLDRFRERASLILLVCFALGVAEVSALSERPSADRDPASGAAGKMPDFQYQHGFPLLARKKSLVPASDQKEKIERVPHGIKQDNGQNLLPLLPMLPPLEMVNFLPAVVKQPTATDFAENFALLHYLVLPPRALTYPKLYADILRAEIPDALKSKLLGIELPPLEFFRESRQENFEALLDPANAESTASLIGKEVVLGFDAAVTEQKSRAGKSTPKIVVEEFHPGYLRAVVESAEDGFLLYRDGYHPSWRARVNDRPVNLLRANYNEKAVAVTAGKSIVEFIFEPWLYLAALVLYVCANLSFWVFWVGERLRGRRS